MSIMFVLSPTPSITTLPMYQTETASLPMYQTDRQTTVVPKTINRLFVTSFVLSGVILALSISTAYPFGIRALVLKASMALMAIAIITNHLILYLLAKNQPTALSPSVDGRVAYPNCLFGISNIIFAMFMALALIGTMWMPLKSGIMYARYAYYGHLYVSLAGSELILGVVGYAEGCILVTLFILYVRHRKVHMKAVREGRFKI